MFYVFPKSASKGLKFSLSRNWPVWNPNWQFRLLSPVYVLFRAHYLNRTHGSLENNHAASSNVPLQHACNPIASMQTIFKLSLSRACMGSRFKQTIFHTISILACTYCIIHILGDIQPYQTLSMLFLKINQA